MSELVSSVTALHGLVEKGGIIGVLLVFIGLLIWDRVRLVKRLEKTFVERDMARQLQNRYKTLLDQHKISVDISDILLMFQNDKAS